MRALWSDRPNCSHNVSQKVKRIRRLSDLLKREGVPEIRAKPLRGSKWISSLEGGRLSKGSRKTPPEALRGLGGPLLVPSPLLHKQSETAALDGLATRNANRFARIDSHESIRRKQKKNLALPPLRKCVGDFCCVNFGGFCRGCCWRIFLALFPTKMRRKNPREKSGGPKRKIREKSVLPKPTLIFSKKRAIRANRLKPAIRNFYPPKRDSQKKEVQFGTLKRFERIGPSKTATAGAKWAPKLHKKIPDRNSCVTDMQSNEAIDSRTK